MGRKIKDLGIVPERMLGAVAVMQVPVDDQDTPQTAVPPGVGGPDGHVVEQAETHGPMRFGVMTGRADQGKTVIDGPCRQGVDQDRQPPGGLEGRHVGKGGSLSVRVQSHQGPPGRGRHPAYMVRRMDGG